MLACDIVAILLLATAACAADSSPFEIDACGTGLLANGPGTYSLLELDGTSFNILANGTLPSTGGTGPAALLAFKKPNIIYSSGWDGQNHTIILSTIESGSTPLQQTKSPVEVNSITFSNSFLIASDLLGNVAFFESDDSGRLQYHGSSVLYTLPSENGTLPEQPFVLPDPTGQYLVFLDNVEGALLTYSASSLNLTTRYNINPPCEPLSAILYPAPQVAGVPATSLFLQCYDRRNSTTVIQVYEVLYSSDALTFALSEEFDPLLSLSAPPPLAPPPALTVVGDWALSQDGQHLYLGIHSAGPQPDVIAHWQVVPSSLGGPATLQFTDAVSAWELGSSMTLGGAGDAFIFI